MSVQYWTGVRAPVKAYILQVKMTRAVFFSEFSVCEYMYNVHINTECRAWILDTFPDKTMGSLFCVVSAVIVNCEGLIRPVKMIVGGVLLL